MSNHLISLELQGYKTFASKTVFKFPAQLTAVVGPNGSGKSNIADAIRWVLGEQAYSLLRGKKTVDMIFSGSEQRARASMASASITFDNHTGWLPIDFTEVNITRRAYRNGENEYLLNNQKVRLKEINELLASSGLAERNYTIIGQGMVDSALSIKPEDRRGFFEEAAGIGLYRSRRGEANLKLEKTSHNVQRINDIVLELKPRIRSLEKQQEKSKSYLQIDADLKLLLKDWYGFYWHQTQKNLKAALYVNAEQQELVNETRAVRQKLETQLDQAQTSLHARRSRLSELHLTLSKLHMEKEENSRQLAVLEERAKAQKTRLIEFEMNAQIDQDRKESIDGEIADILKQGDDSQQEYRQMEVDLKEEQEKLNHRLSQRTDINASIYEQESAINRSTQEILRLNTLIEGLHRQISLRDSDMQKLKAVNEKNTAVYKIQAGDLTELKQIKENLNEELRLQGAAKEEINSKVDTLQEDIEDARGNQQKCDNLLRKLQGELNLLEEAEQSLVGFSSGAKAVVDAVRAGKLSGEFSLLMDYLDIPEEYETAIASALGTVVEGIVLNSDREVDQIVDYIDRIDAPRTVLIENQKSGLSEDSQKIPNGMIPAMDVITGGKRNEVLVKNLLSRVFIADDFDSARAEAENLSAGYQIVTLKGELFSADRTITIGKEARIRTFARKREKVAIETELRSTETTQSEVEEKLASLEQKQQEKQKTLENVLAEIRRLENEINTITLKIHKVEIEQEQRKKQIENEEVRIQEFLSGVEKEQNDIIQLAGNASELEKDIAGKKNNTEALVQEIKILPVEELRAKVMDLNSKLAVAKQLVENNKNRLSEKQTLQDTYTKNIKNITGRIGGSKKSQEEIIAQIVDIKRTDQTVTSRISELTNETQPLERSVEKEITDQSKFLEDVDAARRKFAVAERHKMQAQMKVEKLREKIERYQMQIGKDFGIFMGEEELAYGPKPLPIDSIVSQLPYISELPEGISDQISQKKAFMRRLGPINPNALQEYKEVNERYLFLTEQLLDLDKAEKDLRKIIEELDVLMKKEFMKTFKKVAVEFENIFTQLFNGGKARLIIEDEENILDSGIDIEATLPGRRKQELALLSGGERSLTAIALIFALLKISPTPFCILDEIDAMLDESNVLRVGELLKELSDTTQFIIITHNRNTVQLADIIYGVTMGKDSVSQVISVKLDELTDEMVH